MKSVIRHLPSCDAIGARWLARSFTMGSRFSLNGMASIDQVQTAILSSPTTTRPAIHVRTLLLLPRPR